MPPAPISKLPLKLSSVIGSYGFAVVLLLFLLLLTWLGTLEQVELGLKAAQDKYFNSPVLVHECGPFAVRFPWSSGEPLFTIPAFPLPLPGAFLVLALLMLNLLVGGIVRLRKDLARAGILVAHLGIVMMLAGSLWEYYSKLEGFVALWPRETGREFKSFHEWEIAIRPAAESGVVREFAIPEDDWTDLERGESRRFTCDELPFDLTVTRWFTNCAVVPKGPMFPGDGPTIDGFVVMAAPPQIEAEANVAGAYVTFTEKATGRQTDAILDGSHEKADILDRLRGRPLIPFTLSAGGKDWIVLLRKKRMDLPFALRLDRFSFAMHPDTETPRFFRSDATKIEEGREQPVVLTMNEPVRGGGYTIFQSGYGPGVGWPMDAEHYSSFQVVSNPTDQWPKWSCWVIATGLLYHFARKLVRHVKAENQRAAVTVRTK